MSTYRDHLVEAVRATEIHAAGSFSWFGRKAPSLPRRIRSVLSDATLRSYLHLGIQDTLYSSFYCRGFAAPIEPLDAGSETPGGDAAFVKELSDANRGSGCWEEGWEAKLAQEGLLVAEKDGLRLRAGPGEWRAIDGRDGGPETAIALRLPREWLGMSPGFYMALGNETLLAPGGLVRFYWNVTPAGALRLMREATARLNTARVSFRLKALNNPQAFRRCDAAVLYIRKVDFDRVAGILEEMYSHVSDGLMPDVPMFSKRLAPGLGFAEDPGETESFGSSRCGLVAEGMLQAFEQNAAGVDERLPFVERCFASAGIDLEKPFLNAGSADVYAFQPSVRSGNASRDDRPPETHRDREPLLEHASAIARRLCGGALWSGARCNWVGVLPEGVDHDAVGATARLAALGPDVYSGTAGLALFLAEAGSKTGDAGVRKTALGAIRHALSRADDPEARRAPGFYAGWTGIALSAARVGRLLRAPALLEESASLVRRMAKARYDRGEFDLLCGRAGAIAAVLILRDLLGDPRLLTLAVRMGDQLLRSAERRGSSLSWRASASSRGPNLTGFSHGAAGVGCALMELFHATGEPKYREAGLAAFRYEQRWFDAQEGNWPDFRRLSSRRPGRTSPRPFATAWCHGAPGIALSRLRAFEITGDESCRREAEIALKTTQKAVEADLTRGGGGSSLCHGLAGNADVLLCGSRVLGGPMSGIPDVLARVADQVLAEISARDALGKAVQRSGESWGLMAGLAGSGYFLLRLSDPDIPSLLMLAREPFLTSRADRNYRRPRHRSGPWPRNRPLGSHPE